MHNLNVCAVGYGRNRAVEQSSGTYLCFCDLVSGRVFCNPKSCLQEKK